ncbi:MAG TPA: hypothetical protein PLW75_14495 [Hyphomicrobium sp.]|nr:hypothetical protein [Hyphomicrobium sp.]
MKQLLTAIVAGVGLFAGLNAATAASDHKAAAPSQMKLATDSNAAKDVTTHSKAKADAQRVKKPKATGNSAGASSTQKPMKKPNS